jgi:hypothetical protein
LRSFAGADDPARPAEQRWGTARGTRYKRMVNAEAEFDDLSFHQAAAGSVACTHARMRFTPRRGATGHGRAG